VRHSDTVPVLLRELGQQLAALRREAGLTQENLGALAGFSPSTVSVAEIGRQPHAREFWAACDKALDSGGVLDVICAVLGCEPGELLIPEPATVPGPGQAGEDTARAASAGPAVVPRRPGGRSLPPA
jgi:transcriptional regulator with XRE-family HTH domain